MFVFPVAEDAKTAACVRPVRRRADSPLTLSPELIADRRTAWVDGGTDLVLR
jgi:hypothetical protein